MAGVISPCSLVLFPRSYSLSSFSFSLGTRYPRFCNTFEQSVGLRIGISRYHHYHHHTILTSIPTPLTTPTTTTPHLTTSPPQHNTNKQHNHQNEPLNTQQPILHPLLHPTIPHHSKDRPARPRDGRHVGLDRPVPQGLYAGRRGGQEGADGGVDAGF